MLLRRALGHCLLITMALFLAFAPPGVRVEAMGIALEGFPYPLSPPFHAHNARARGFAPCLYGRAARWAIERAASRPSARPKFPISGILKQRSPSTRRFLSFLAQ